MSLLILSPDYVSHYEPLAVIGRAVRRSGRDVTVATGPVLRERVEADGFAWRMLRLGAASNAGLADVDPAIERFLDATRAGPVRTIRRQALDREADLLWEPERVAVDVARLCDAIEPDEVLVDHVSFGATLGMHATGRSFVTLVPGHPSQLPVADERYGIPAIWPRAIQPDPVELAGVERLADRVTTAFTRRWNAAVAQLPGGGEPVADAFRVHGRRVLFNSPELLHDPVRTDELPTDHRFVGPLVRDEPLPPELAAWATHDGRARVFVGLGTFLSHRDDVLELLVGALRRLGVRAAVAIGASDRRALGPIPDDWFVAPRLPQVAMFGHADLVVHHGGNNSVQESLAAGARQFVLPFSTDQFSNAADLERVLGVGVRSPNDARVATLMESLDAALQTPRPAPVERPADRDLVAALFGPSSSTAVAA